MFRDIGERVGDTPVTLNLNDDDVTLQGEQDLDLFGGLSTTPALDVNRDGIDDLGHRSPVCAGPRRESLTSYTDRARADPTALTNAPTAIPLENFPVPGAGAFLERTRSSARIQPRTSTATASRISRAAAGP